MLNTIYNFKKIKELITICYIVNYIVNNDIPYSIMKIINPFYQFLYLIYYIIILKFLFHS